MLLRDALRALEEIAPLSAAASWDNVGLLVGDPSRDVSPVLFKPVARVTAPGLVYDAIANGLAIYCPHTALDAADGGTNDVLADALGMAEKAPLQPVAPKDKELKLVFFVPAEHAEKVSRAVFDAGAGRIGQYSSCSFRAPGQGT